MRDAIWKASDAMNHAVQDVPSVGFGERKSDTNEKLARLGDMVEKIDEKYFGTYNRGTGATTSYLDSIGTAAAEGAETEAGKGATGGSPKDDKPDKDKGEDKKVAKAANDAASAVTEAKDAAAKSSKKGDAPTESASAAVDAAADSVKAKADESAGSAAGTVQLDRPKQVQGVFDDLQKKAVEYYKSSPVAKATSSVPGTKFGSSSSEGVATAMPDVVQTLETELESLLTESSFKPRRLKNERKQKLVAAIEAMEKAYPADANPLADPALSGQWSVSVGRALKGALAKLFKTSDARQVVNSEASSIINACRARLRLTPLSLQVAQKGKYRSTAERQVSVDLSVSGGRKLLRGLLPGLPAGKVSAEAVGFRGYAAAAAEAVAYKQRDGIFDAAGTCVGATHTAIQDLRWCPVVGEKGCEKNGDALPPPSLPFLACVVLWSGRFWELLGP
eukprot:jgi/Undpi1/10086/HiC_scaffold_28.g12540.m1